LFKLRSAQTRTDKIAINLEAETLLPGLLQNDAIVMPHL